MLSDEKSEPVAFSIFVGFAAGVPMLIAGQFVSGLFDFTLDMVPRFWPNLLLMASVYGLANVCIFSSLKIIEASQFEILFAARILFTILAVTLLLGEGLGATQFVGVVLIILAVVLVNRQGSKITLGKGEIIALVGAMLFGIGNANDRYLLGHMNAYTDLTISFLLASVFMSMLYPRQLVKSVRFLKGGVVAGAVGYCILYTSASLFYLHALRFTDNASQVASVAATSTIATVLLGALILKERDRVMEKFLAALVAVIGVILVV